MATTIHVVPEPEVRRPTDPVIIYCWLRDTCPVLVDEMEVVLYEPKVEPSTSSRLVGMAGAHGLPGKPLVDIVARAWYNVSSSKR